MPPDVLPPSPSLMSPASSELLASAPEYWYSHTHPPPQVQTNKNRTLCNAFPPMISFLKTGACSHSDATSAPGVRPGWHQRRATDWLCSPVLPWCCWWHPRQPPTPLSIMFYCHKKILHWLLSLISLLILFLCQWDEGRRLKCWKLNMFPILQSTTVFVNTVIISLSIRAESTDIINFSPKHWKGFRSIHYSLNHKYHQSFQDPSNIQI